MMIQDAIREFHDAIALPAMAPIAVERPTQSGAADRYEARTGARLRRFEHNVVQFVAASNALAGKLRCAESQPNAEAEVSELTDFVEYLEGTAERMAVADARTEKHMMREAKLQERRDPSLAAAHRRAAELLATLNAQTIETILGLALEVRTLRSTLSAPNTSSGFESPDDLGHYIDLAVKR